MKSISTVCSLIAAAALFSSCKSNDTQAQTSDQDYASPYYGPQPTTYAQNGDYVNVTPVQPQQDYSYQPPQQDYTYQPPQQDYSYQPQQPAYQPPSYDSQPAYQPQQPAYQPPAETVPVSGARSHTVVKGDTLYSISRRYGSTVSGIQQANSLNGTLIIPGNVLSIP